MNRTRLPYLLMMIRTVCRASRHEKNHITISSHDEWNRMQSFSNKWNFHARPFYHAWSHSTRTVIYVLGEAFYKIFCLGVEPPFQIFSAKCSLLELNQHSSSSASQLVVVVAQATGPAMAAVAIVTNGGSCTSCIAATAVIKLVAVTQ
jgi:hypothetical protein